MTGAFLRGPSTKDARCEVEPVFLHVCLAFVFINYWQLKPTELAKYDNPAEQKLSFLIECYTDIFYLDFFEIIRGETSPLLCDPPTFQKLAFYIMCTFGDNLKTHLQLFLLVLHQSSDPWREDKQEGR